MDLIGLDPQNVDGITAEGIAEVIDAARQAEPAGAAPTSAETVRLQKRFGWGEQRADWLTVARVGDRIVGSGTMMFPPRSNRHLAYVWISVHPEHQRQGIGSTLLRAAEGVALANRRRSLVGFTARDGAGAAFAGA